MVGPLASPPCSFRGELPCSMALLPASHVPLPTVAGLSAIPLACHIPAGCLPRSMPALFPTCPSPPLPRSIPAPVPASPHGTCPGPRRCKTFPVASSPCSVLLRPPCAALLLHILHTEDRYAAGLPLGPRRRDVDWHAQGARSRGEEEHMACTPVHAAWGPATRLARGPGLATRREKLVQRKEDAGESWKRPTMPLYVANCEWKNKEINGEQ